MADVNEAAAVSEAEQAVESEEPAKKSFSEEEVNKLISSRVSQERKKWEKVAEERATEAERLAGMTAEQKAQHERRQLEEKLSKREVEITRRELRAEAKETLSSKELPVELADCLTYTDAETCKASLDAVSKAFEKAVSKAVDARLRQSPPKTGDNNGDALLESIKAAAGLKK